MPDRRAHAPRNPTARLPWPRLALTLIALVQADATSAQQQQPGLTSTPLPARATSDDGPKFVKHGAERTGIDFVHRFSEERVHINVLANAMSGGGVAAGDYDGDGRDDFYITRATGGCRLFRNLGDLRFEDVTVAAGLTDDEAWGTGACFVDVNGDGHLDLYVCGYDTPNRLFVNQGDGTFEEGAEAAGLAYSGASILGAFADYDGDGDLDCFLLTNRLNPFSPPDRAVPTKDGMPYIPEGLEELYAVMVRPDGAPAMVSAGQADHLYRNEGDGTFVEVSDAAGIAGNHFGLSATWWDHDGDGWLDLYVANDFFGPDKLYRNQGDGTFVDVAPEALPRTPWFSMGSDAGDVDNDGWLDYFSSDMAGTTHRKRMTALGETTEVRWFLEMPTPRQAMRNTLFQNTGTGVFREVANMAGVEASDWTWATLFADLDEDGLLDLYATNGFTRDYFDSDLRARAFAEGDPNDAIKSFWVDQPILDERNLCFRNLGELSFERTEAAWGLDHLGVSFGAVQADFDGDGDLDIVTNDYEAGAGVYENRTSGTRRIAVTLRGQGGNGPGFGAIVRVTSALGQQMRQLGSSRGFMSGQTGRAHFGLGSDRVVQQLTVEWPSGHVQQFSNLPADRSYVVSEPATPAPGPAARARRRPQPLFASSLGEDSTEQVYEEFSRQTLLPSRLSQQGPGLAVADIDRDGTLDFALGGPAGQALRLFRNVANQRFEAWPQPALTFDDYYEDMGLLLFDAEGDGDTDLYAVSGGVECSPGSKALRDRLYLNDDQGALSHAPEGALPDLRDSGSIVVAGDLDADGDLDLFVGGRSVPGAWPTTPMSRLLRNDDGRFVDATDEVAEGLKEAGMVTSAVFTDVDDDGALDLVVTREWNTVGLWLHDKGSLREATVESGLAERHGLWNSVVAGDLEGDGDIDLVVTNVGLNTPYRASAKHPMLLFYGDCDGGGEDTVVEATWDGDRLVPFRDRSRAMEAMPIIGELYPTYAEYAAASLNDIYPTEFLAETLQLSLDTLESGVLRNDGTGRFDFEPLPRIAQVAPGYGLLLQDIDADGQLDLVIAQNSFAPQPETGRFDGGVGQVLLGRGTSWLPMTPAASGVVVPADGKSLVASDFNGDGHPDLMMGVNDGPLRAFFNLRTHGGRTLVVDLVGPPGNPTAVGARVTLTTEKGVRQMAEVSAGGGWLSQTAARRVFGLGRLSGRVSIEVRWPDGQTTRHETGVDAGRVELRSR